MTFFNKNIIFVSLGIVFLVAIVGVFLWRPWENPIATNTNSVSAQNTNRENSQANTNQQNADEEQLTDADKAGKELSGRHCTGTDKPKFTHLPMDPKDFAFILPYGLMVGGHVTPVDHQYFSPIVFDSPVGTYNVYAMADSHLVDIQTRTHQGQGQNKDKTVTDYRLVFYMSCRLLYYYDLINSLTPGLQDEWKANDGDLSVKAGQLIGKIGGQTLDFAVWDTDKPLTGFIVPEHYDRESWKQYTADPLDYYADDIKTAALAKYVRTAEPKSGKIDYDVDGKLIGNWFQEGTNGYGGTVGNGQSGYWTGHLSVSPYFLDPTGFLISIGNWPGEASQFATKENGPNPADVDVSTGLVKYNLVQFRGYKSNGQSWDSMTLPNSPVTLHKQSSVEGCMLIQMTGERTLKAEAFKGKSCSNVSGFTSAATMYER